MTRIVIAAIAAFGLSGVAVNADAVSDAVAALTESGQCGATPIVSTQIAGGNSIVTCGQPSAEQIASAEAQAAAGAGAATGAATVGGFTALGGVGAGVAALAGLLVLAAGSGGSSSTPSSD